MMNLFCLSYDFIFSLSLSIQAKPASEYERPVTPEVESLLVRAEPAVTVIEQESVTHTESPTEIEHEAIIHTESQPEIEHKPQVHLEPRPATIEPVDVQAEPAPVVIVSLTKSEEKTVTKKSTTLDLHGAAVDLPKVELVTPGPLPTLSISKEKKTTKVKKPSAGLCASCFGAKSASKKKKEAVSEPVQVPIEPKKSIGQEEKKDLSPIIEVPSSTEKTADEPILPKVNIDIFKERTFQKSTEVEQKSIIKSLEIQMCFLDYP